MGEAIASKVVNTEILTGTRHHSRLSNLLLAQNYTENNPSKCFWSVVSNKCNRYHMLKVMQKSVIDEIFDTW
jgi:hypothetical protein